MESWGWPDRRNVSRGRSFSPEFRDAAVREVIEKSRTIAEVARENGLVAQTLGSWVAAWRGEHPEEESEPPLTLSERARLRELERENRELRMENEFLGKATAFFAKKSR